MTILEAISRNHRAELQALNDRIHQRLQGGNSMMEQIILSMLRTRGKQIRPLMVYLCSGISGDVNDRTLASAVAVELLHNASLIHDDVVDNSPTRRGRPTINAVWDNHIAVLVGDFFTSSAMQEAISTDDIGIVDVLCGLGRQLSLGEIDQIYNAREHSFSEEAYYRVVDYKTASLFVASAHMGCLSARAPQSVTEALAEYALLFGRCFQIRDDVFDYFPASQVGKPTGNDLREGKVSLPLIYVLDHIHTPEADDIRATLMHDQLTDTDIDRIQTFARDNGGIDYAFDTMHRLRDRAAEILYTFEPSQYRDELMQLFDFTIARRF